MGSEMCIRDSIYFCAKCNFWDGREIQGSEGSCLGNLQLTHNLLSGDYSPSADLEENLTLVLLAKGQLQTLWFSLCWLWPGCWFPNAPVIRGSQVCCSVSHKSPPGHMTDMVQYIPSSRLHLLFTFAIFSEINYILTFLHYNSSLC